MASFKDHHSSSIAKMLIVGDPGTGKTSLLGGAANAGYKVRILDFDNGLDVLRAYTDPANYDNIQYVTLVDEPGKPPRAFDTATRLIFKEWIDPTTNISLGKVTDWGADTILVVDSASSMSDAALRKALAAAGKTASDKLSQPDWGEAVRYVNTLLYVLLSDTVKCHVVILSHLVKSGEDNSSKEYPNVVTRTYSSKVGAKFNNIFRAEKRIIGKEEKVVLRTKADPRTDLKSSISNQLPAELPPDLPTLIKLLTSDKDSA